MRKAFTYVELVFVVVIIGILSAIAIPKFVATRDDATLTKAKTTVANIRSALSSEVQRRVLEGNYDAITNVGGTTGTYDSPIFDFFDGDNTKNRVLEYPLRSCKDAQATGCWIKTGNNTYRYKLPAGVGGEVDFKVNNNRFECTSNWDKCKYLER